MSITIHFSALIVFQVNKQYIFYVLKQNGSNSELSGSYNQTVFFHGKLKSLTVLVAKPVDLEYFNAIKKQW